MLAAKTLGELMDRMSDDTILDLHFTKDDQPREAVPYELSYRPTVGQLRKNTYLRELPIDGTQRFRCRNASYGYDVYVPAKFEAAQFTK